MSDVSSYTFYESKFIPEDLRRLQIDDVRNSEYIEEEDIKRFSIDQRSQLFRESNVIVTNDDVLFRFQTDGGTGGLEGFNKKALNRSHDMGDEDPPQRSLSGNHLRAGQTFKSGEGRYLS